MEEAHFSGIVNMESESELEFSWGFVFILYEWLAVLSMRHKQDYLAQTSPDEFNRGGSRDTDGAVTTLVPFISRMEINDDDYRIMPLLCTGKKTKQT